VRSRLPVAAKSWHNNNDDKQNTELRLVQIQCFLNGNFQQRATVVRVGRAWRQKPKTIPFQHALAEKKTLLAVLTATATS